jgi:hypothetical protein
MSSAGVIVGTGEALALGRPRPALFRALGEQEPPTRISVAGVPFEWLRTFKHDSWAATALYENVWGERVVCKFNREQPILGVPMRWLGRLLARRENQMLELLHHEPGVPRLSGLVSVAGRRVPSATAHDYIPGRPLHDGDNVEEEFFAELGRVLDRVHALGIAYVDLHKRENVLVGDDGRPYLIDFQISAKLPRVWPLSAVLWLLQQSDRYHLAKHVYRQRPDLCGPALAARVERPPWWIRMHRQLAVPFRRLRRRLLVWLGIRTGRGRAQSEYEPELGCATVEKAIRPGASRDSSRTSRVGSHLRRKRVCAQALSGGETPVSRTPGHRERISDLSTSATVIPGM